MGVAINPLRQN